VAAAARKQRGRSQETSSAWRRKPGHDGYDNTRVRERPPFATSRRVRPTSPTGCRRCTRILRTKPQKSAGKRIFQPC
jgi:hypothetical protein